MSRRTAHPGVMLELWRPPHDAGDPLGCLATTYTFAPGLFDEQCLGRFLEIESEPDREDLAFLLERETRLGGVYAGVLVDHTQAGVEHSLRWDVLPVRIRGGKQHAKVSLLVWARHIRIIVASANLTEQGYRTNQEVAGAVEVAPNSVPEQTFEDAIGFLRRLIRFVPGTAQSSPAVQRAETFLADVQQLVHGWQPTRGRSAIRQHLVFTMPVSRGSSARSTMEDALDRCRGRGGSPYDVRVASPFFDDDASTSQVTSVLCKGMARGVRRTLTLALPGALERGAGVPRLHAPRSVLSTARRYVEDVSVALLPAVDADKNPRIWHAKMVGFKANSYSALMIGSSNFTTAGMGVGNARNAEANLLTIVDYVKFDRHEGRLEAVWPDMGQVANPDAAEWRGADRDSDEEERATLTRVPLPPGFLTATYRAGERRQVVLGLDPAHLPPDWRVHTTGVDAQDILSAETWQANGSAAIVTVEWTAVRPPEKLLVLWEDNEAFWPLNVDDQRALPPPSQLDGMTADDMLDILAASDPSAAFRMWARRQQASETFDHELDGAVPIDLDPLRRFDLHATFLHRVRRRARTLAQLRANLQRAVSGRQALEWRLRGLVGIEPLADRLVRELSSANGSIDEALLTLADFLIVLREVDYTPVDGGLSKREYESVFGPFLRELTDKLARQVAERRVALSTEAFSFWQRVVERCRERT